MNILDRVVVSLIEQGNGEIAELLGGMDCKAFRIMLEEAYSIGYEDGASMED
jgi:hypothetical protein